ncbi:MAG TPA: hypothetical protein VF699_04275 [Caulobacteraceae bacterium]|jgi:hypothetical protein
MKNFVLAGALLLLTAGAAAAEAPNMTAQRLTWDRKPLGTHLDRFFPAAAKQAGIKNATVDVTCTPDKWGALSCESTAETPAGLGFAEAAEMTLEKARVAATDRTSPEGRTFRYRVHFGKGLQAGKTAELAPAR